MVNNSDLINLVNNKKPVELVQELNKVPSYEEFIKTCENEGNLNYDDLNSSDIGTQKGYGPCLDNPFCNRCSTAELERQAAQLRLQRELRERNRSFRIVINHAARGFFSHISQLVSTSTWDGMNWNRVQNFTITSVDSARNIMRRLRLGLSNPVSMTGLFGTFPSDAPSDALYVVNR